MNKRTRAIDEDTYKLIIATMKNGFTHEGVQYKPNERIATVLVLEYNLGLRVGIPIFSKFLSSCHGIGRK